MFFTELHAQEDSKVFGHARYLDQFFEQQLRKWLPQYTLGLTMGASVSGAANNADETTSFTSGSAKRPRSTVDLDAVHS